MKSRLFIFFLIITTKAYCQIDSVSIIQSTSKKDIPVDLYRFININSVDEIANPNEEWNAGCMEIGGLPRKQFHWLIKDRFNNTVILFSQGGVGRYTTCLVMNNIKKTVHKYNGFELEGALSYKEVYFLIASDKLEKKILQ